MVDNLPPKKGVAMATVSARPRSAEDELLDHLGKQFDEAAEKESPRKFTKRAKKAIANLRRATAALSRRRGTA